MPMHNQSIVEEWEAVGPANTASSLPEDLAELCLNRQCSLSTFTIRMPMQISPSEMAIPPRRFEKKAKSKNAVPSGPSFSTHNYTKLRSEQGLSSSEEIEATGPLA